MQKADCNTCQNQKCLVKQNIKEIEAAGFLEYKHTINCKKSRNFILEGAPVHGLFFVYKGKVKVYKTGINGREQIVRFAKDGEIIGHRGFGAGQFYQVSAETIEDTILCDFTNDILMEMLKKIPELTFNLMTFYAEELNRSETKVRKFAQMTVREKVIDAVLYFNRKFGQTDGYLNIRLSRKEIADFAGTTDEQVIRVISSLKKENLLHTEGKKIGVIDIDSLRKEIADHNFFLNS